MPLANLEIGIQIIAEFRKDEGFSTCLNPMLTTSSEICPPVDEANKGTNIY